MSHIWENCGKQNVLFQRNSSTSNSSTAHDRFKSKLLTTSGCETPMIPIGLPLAMNCAQRPGKKVSSEKKKQLKIHRPGVISNGEGRVTNSHATDVCWVPDLFNSLRALLYCYFIVLYCWETVLCNKEGLKTRDGEVLGWSKPVPGSKIEGMAKYHKMRTRKYKYGKKLIIT